MCSSYVDDKGGIILAANNLDDVCSREEEVTRLLLLVMDGDVHDDDVPEMAARTRMDG